MWRREDIEYNKIVNKSYFPEVESSDDQRDASVTQNNTKQWMWNKGFRLQENAIDARKFIDCNIIAYIII